MKAESFFKTAIAFRMKGPCEANAEARGGCSRAVKSQLSLATTEDDDIPGALYSRCGTHPALLPLEVVSLQSPESSQNTPLHGLQPSPAAIGSCEPAKPREFSKHTIARAPTQPCCHWRL